MFSFFQINSTSQWLLKDQNSCLKTGYDCTLFSSCLFLAYVGNAIVQVIIDWNLEISIIWNHSIVKIMNDANTFCLSLSFIESLKGNFNYILKPSCRIPFVHAYRTVVHFWRAYLGWVTDWLTNKCSIKCLHITNPLRFFLVFYLRIRYS